MNSAGIGSSGPVETIDLDKAMAVCDTNVWGAVRTIRAALPAMRAEGSGVIINVTSVAGRVRGSPYGGFYADVAADPDAPMHNLLGDDADMFVDLVEQAGTFEGWVPIGIGILEGVSGPRPV